MFTPATALFLDPSQRRVLESLARAGTTPQSVARKCEVILLASAGVSNNSIAQRTGLSRPTIIAARAAFGHGGVEALRQRQKRNRSRRVLTPELEEKILDTTLKTMPPDATHWSVRTLASHLGVTRTLVHGVWRRFDVRPRRVERPKIEKRVRDVLQAGLPERQPHGYKRYGTTNSEKLVSRSDKMTDPKLPRKVTGKEEKPAPKGQGVDEGLAAAAAKNRERDARLRLIDALERLPISSKQWPNFVREFRADPLGWIEYHAFMTPPPFQPPEFDRLTESSRDWAKRADSAWELHRNKCLQEWKDWVRAGVDEEIVEPKRVRGTAKKVPARVSGRGENTPIDQRYEWAAKYLLKVPLKEIAGANADAATVGKVAREIVRMAGWDTK